MTTVTMNKINQMFVYNHVTVEKAQKLAARMTVKSVEEIVAEIMASKDVIEEWAQLSRMNHALFVLDIPVSGQCLASQIMYQQGRSLEQYGFKAFRLSEKQISVIVREYHFPLRQLGLAVTGQAQF